MLDEWYGIMPNKVLFDKELSDKAKLLFCLISSLCAEKWFCRAGNEYISEKMWMSERTVREHIGILVKYGYITLVVEKGNQRKITIWAVADSRHGDGESMPWSGGEIPPHNIISYKTTKENKIQEFWDRLKQEWFSEELIQVILDFDKKKKKWKMSQMEDKYLKKWIKELKTYWENKNELMIQVIEQSIINWRDWLFAVKKQAHYTPRVDAINRH